MSPPRQAQQSHLSLPTELVREIISYSDAPSLRSIAATSYHLSLYCARPTEWTLQNELRTCAFLDLLLSCPTIAPTVRDLAIEADIFREPCLVSALRRKVDKLYRCTRTRHRSCCRASACSRLASRSSSAVSFERSRSSISRKMLRISSCWSTSFLDSRRSSACPSGMTWDHSSSTQSAPSSSRWRRTLSQRRSSPTPRLDRAPPFNTHLHRTPFQSQFDAGDVGDCIGDLGARVHRNAGEVVGAVHTRFAQDSTRETRGEEAGNGVRCERYRLFGSEALRERYVALLSFLASSGLMRPFDRRSRNPGEGGRVPRSSKVLASEVDVRG